MPTPAAHQGGCRLGARRFAAGRIDHGHRKVTGKTGVEMEALTAVSVAALTVYDMAKSRRETMRIQNIRVVEKTRWSFRRCGQ